MINKKLLRFDPDAMRYVAYNVLCQWLALLCNAAFVAALARMVGAAFGGAVTAAVLVPGFAVCLVSLPLRWGCTTRAAVMSHKASENVKSWAPATAKQCPPPKR